MVFHLLWVDRPILAKEKNTTLYCPSTGDTISFTMGQLKEVLGQLPDKTHVVLWLVCKKKEKRIVYMVNV